jgi:hypothetical protein
VSPVRPNRGDDLGPPVPSTCASRRRGGGRGRQRRANPRRCGPATHRRVARRGGSR